MMSPTYYAVRMQQLEEQLETARIAGDLPSMQKLRSQQAL